MYLDTDNFIRELSYKQFCRKRKKEPHISYDGRTYINFTILKQNNTEIVRVFVLLSSDHTFVIKESIDALFLEHKDIDVVYTKLDLAQTFSQVRVNKYFKSMFGARQLIWEQ